MKGEGSGVAGVRAEEFGLFSGWHINGPVDSECGLYKFWTLSENSTGLGI